MCQDQNNWNEKRMLNVWFSCSSVESSLFLENKNLQNMSLIKVIL